MRDRTRHEEHAGEGVESGAVPESLQCVQGASGARVTGDHPDGFMHGLDRLAPARRLEVGGAQAAGAAPRAPCDGTGEGGPGGTLPECMQRDERSGEAVIA